MERGSPEWIDLKILNSLDKMWNKKGKYLSAWELMSYLESQGDILTLDAINERLYWLCAARLIEAMQAPNGAGKNAPMQLRYNRTRPRWWAELH
jgi:hypothetical protein